MELRNRDYSLKHKTVQKLMKELSLRNFFRLLKSELLYLREFCSFEEFQAERELSPEYYNHNCIKAKLDGLSPVQYKILS